MSCAGGIHNRYRLCNTPTPQHGGDDCTADGSTNFETEMCNENRCPGMSIILRNILLVEIILFQFRITYFY